MRDVSSAKFRKNGLMFWQWRWWWWW